MDKLSHRQLNYKDAQKVLMNNASPRRSGMTAFSFSSYFRDSQTPGIRAILSQCEITCDLDQGEIVIKAKNPSFAEALLLADFTNTLNLDIRLIARGFNRLKSTKTASN